MTDLDFYEELLAYKPIYARLCEIAEAKIRQSIENGTESTKFKLVKGRRSRLWNADADTLELQFGDAIWDEPKLKSVPQAEKIFDKTEVLRYTKWLDGPNLLVPKKDIKDAISVNASEFN